MGIASLSAASTGFEAVDVTSPGLVANTHAVPIATVLGPSELDPSPQNVVIVSEQQLCAVLLMASDLGIPFLRIEETETASVGAIIAENSAACCHIQPLLLKSNTYSRMGVMSAVEAMTMRNANTSTW